MRADRLEDRTAEKVAAASTSVPTAVAKEGQSTARRGIKSSVCQALPVCAIGPTEGPDWATTSDAFDENPRNPHAEVHGQDGAHGGDVKSLPTRRHLAL